MTADRLPSEVREFAHYLDGLLSRLDPSGGWCAVFWQRDPEGMRACLDGRELPPWDVVEALLQDLAGQYGPGGAGPESERARSLHASALAAYDALPGARDALGDRLDVMLREQKYAADRRADLTRLLASATTREQAEAVRLDLAWAHDDHERATARCAELRARLADLDRRERDAAGLRPRGEAGFTVRTGRTGPGEAPRMPDSGVPLDAPGGYGGGITADGGRWAGAVAGAGADADDGRVGSGGAAAAPRSSSDTDVPRAGWRPTEPGSARQPGAGSWLTEPGSTGGPGGGAWAAGGRSAEPGAAGAPGSRLTESGSSGASGVGAWAAGGRSAEPGAAGTPGAGVRPTEPGSAGRPAAGWRSAEAAAAGAGSVGPQGARYTAVGPEPEPHAHGNPADWTGPREATAPPQTSSEPPAAETPAPKQRKRRRGSARFAGMSEEEAAPVVVPPAAVPTLPAPAPATGRSPRGARFAGAAEEAVAEHTDPQVVEPVGATDRAEVGRTVETLTRLRREGRSGEAHAVLIEAASWSPARFPLLADALERAGLGADWQTLLWEAASLPAGRLVAAADALSAAGRAGDGQQILRQGVARPPREVGRAVLGLVAEERRREVRALLDAYVRVRTPEEAARSVEPDPQRLVPLLLEAARGVSDERRWDLLHALRVAGFPA
ncbi:hypothetical protein [Streptomyces sp. NRRL S-474]|uniref:hypothetical protein n=1 Tax=Streptomyces sp. NRRL S-474 TaxID=1463909 RepID=UPI0004C9744D|nr:hypothetical protein [Streptomyces sp. NRRL S-474]